jgi:hypothetical protein
MKPVRRRQLVDHARSTWQASMEVHGPVSGDIAVAIITKAKDAWVQDAAAMQAGARGNQNALLRLPEDLRAFVMSYLDDDQRAELAMSDVVTAIPELERFRKLGEADWPRSSAKADCSRLSPFQN